MTPSPAWCVEVLSWLIPSVQAASTGRSRRSGSATAILTLRVKQGLAEWYVRDLIEKNRRGMEESVRQGWHTGGPVP